MSNPRCIGIFTAGLDDEYQASLWHAMEQEAARRGLGTISFSSPTTDAPAAYTWCLRNAFFSFIMAVLMIPAQVSGIGFYQFMYRIRWTDSLMPLILPASASLAIFTFVASWNTLFIPLILLTRQEKYTMPIMVSLLRGDIYKTEYGSVYLGLTLTVLPLFVIYFILSKYIIAGVALGALKE